MKEIKLTRGLVALVDDEDFDWLNQFRWHVCISPKCRSIYAGAHVGPQRKNRLMHRELLNLHDPQIHVDHRDGNGLNNQRSNLRIATRSQNQANRTSPRSDKTSRYKGVAWDKQQQMWRVQLKYCGRKHHLGRFYDETEAAKAYDNGARRIFGEFARPNFPQCSPIT